jgi:diguanylate cyclase (GGDEF)-like protein/PAS domain S-box-containing protein
VVFGLAMVAAAALAGWSWYSGARSDGSLRNAHITLVAAWALCSAVARVAGLVPGPVGSQIADLFEVFASGCGLLALALSLHRLGDEVGGVGAILAEAVLIGASCLTVGWVVTGGPLRVMASTVFSAVPALLGLSTLALLLRSPVVTSQIIRGPGPSRAFWLQIGAGVGLIAAADLLRAIHTFGPDLPAWVLAVITLPGYLFLVRTRRLVLPVPIERVPAPGRRWVLYAALGGAGTAVGAQAVLHGTGPVPVGLLLLVVALLVVLQAFLIYDNDELLTELTLSRQRLAVLVENTSDLLVRLDGNGRILAVNAAAQRLLHRAPVSLQGRSFEELARVEDRRRVREAVLDVTRGRRAAAEVELGLAAPAAGMAQLRLRAVLGGAVANLNDITDSVELRRRLERMARYDQMTGLVNRGHLLEVVGAWLSGQDANVAILYADLDGFKPVNDRFGHAAGDRVLTEAAARFDSVAGAVDARQVIIGRVGGDEFIIAMEGVTSRAAELAGEYIVEAISPPFAVGDRTVQLGVSVGLAGSGPAHGIDVHLGERGAVDLIHRADLAMYAAKAAGRAQVARWHPELEERVRRRVDLAIGLRGALDLGRLAVAYQPIVQLKDGVVIGAEALLRLPSGVDPATLAPGLDALVSPAELVEIAEDTGSITEMGEWVLTQAAQQAAEWARAGHQASVSVNMSVQQLVAPNFVESVQAILDSCGLSPSRLVLELTESQLVGQTGPALQALGRLRAAGVRLAIDDFGTGYSSLSYLRRMPVQVVKVDRALLQDVGIDPRATTLARSVVSMSRDLGLVVVVEGFEDLESVRLLRELGADAGQGFALSPALPAEEMAEILAVGTIDVGLDEPAGPVLKLVSSDLTEERAPGLNK